MTAAVNGRVRALSASPLQAAADEWPIILAGLTRVAGEARILRDSLTAQPAAAGFADIYRGAVLDVFRMLAAAAASHAERVAWWVVSYPERVPAARVGEALADARRWVPDSVLARAIARRAVRGGAG